MYKAALEEDEDLGEGRGGLPYRLLLEELRREEKIERNRERKETLQTLILLTLGVIELQEASAKLGLLIEKLIP